MPTAALRPQGHRGISHHSQDPSLTVSCGGARKDGQWAVSILGLLGPSAPPTPSARGALWLLLTALQQTESFSLLCNHTKEPTWELEPPLEKAQGQILCPKELKI